MTGRAARVVSGRARDRAALEHAWQGWARTVATGRGGPLGATAGVTDDDSFVAIIRFGTVADIEGGADPTSSFRGVLDQLVEPVVEDTERTETWNRGGADDAGFVQVRRGRSSDPSRLRDLYVDEQPIRMGPHRPEVLGGMFAWHDEDAFTLSAYFTSEAEARRGERLHAFESFFDDIEAVMHDVAYLDLREPWLVSSSGARAIS